MGIYSLKWIIGALYIAIFPIKSYKNIQNSENKTKYIVGLEFKCPPKYIYTLNNGNLHLYFLDYSTTRCMYMINL